MFLNFWYNLTTGGLDGYADALEKHNGNFSDGMNGDQRFAYFKATGRLEPPKKNKKTIERNCDNECTPS